jgi:hypothetical protein
MIEDMILNTLLIDESIQLSNLLKLIFIKTCRYRLIAAPVMAWVVDGYQRYTVAELRRAQLVDSY